MTIHLRAITPSQSTLDAKARTIEAIVSTFADAERYDFIERLDPKGADLSRLVGAPVLAREDEQARTAGAHSDHP